MRADIAPVILPLLLLAVAIPLLAEESAAMPPFIAAWAIERIPTDDERIQSIDFVRDLGFNTLITNGTSKAVLLHARARGVRLIQVVSAHAEEGFAERHPQALQKMRDVEDRLRAALGGTQWAEQTAGVFRWVSILQGGKMLCFEHPESQAVLKRRVEDALATADGVALDGLGFANHYACFCERCEAIRAAMKAEHPELSDIEVMWQSAGRTLIDVHGLLYDHAKSVAPEAVVTNHVWPPFRPDEYIGCKLRLDYCTQTIAWFYPPLWRIARVEMEASEMKRLEDRAINRFVPFIGIHDIGDFVRSADRLSAELAVALKYGEGSVVVSRLSTLRKHPALAAAVKAALAR